MKGGVIIGGLTLLFAVSVLAVEATDYSSTNFIIRDPVISVGGALASSTNFRIFSSLGQTAIGQSTSTDFIIRSGFLYYPEPESGASAGRGHAILLYYSPATITTGRLLAEPNLIFSGKAYPNAEVTLLKDAQFAASTIAAPDASFSISLTDVSAGDYILGIYARDNRGGRSLFQTYPIAVIAGQNLNVSNVFIAPTLTLDKSEVKRGDPITLYGQSIPGATITAVINSNHEFLAETETDGNGNYSYGFNTAPLSLGRHLAKTRASFEGTASPFGKLVTFIVGTKNVTAPRVDELAKKSDVNGDGQINLVDLSIFIYWYGQQVGTELPAGLDLNGDGKIDLADFSVMAFYWTG